MIALKIAGLIVGVYAGVRLGKIAIEWIKEGLDRLRPKNFTDKF